MLSYRHGFHAGNFADLLKHLVLCHLLEHLKQKPAPIRYLDTHAGAGVYDLDSDKSIMTGEFGRGVGRLAYDRLPDTIIPFRNAIAPYLARHQYPGSPKIAADLLRPQDEIRLYELHNTDIMALRKVFKDDRRVRVFHDDGFASVKSQLPVKNGRALILMDPSYELQQDYNQVVEALAEGLRRMPHAIFALWYPEVDREATAYLKRRLRALSGEQSWNVELGSNAEHGMRQCGIFVINPPWMLAQRLQPLVSALQAQLDSPSSNRDNL